MILNRLRFCAITTPRFEPDVGVADSFGSGGDDIEARSGMRKLGTPVELGPRLKWNLGEVPGGGRWSAELPLRAVLDLSDGAAHRGWAFERNRMVAWLPSTLAKRNLGPDWRVSVGVGLSYTWLRSERRASA